jgi:hypothetical protein
MEIRGFTVKKSGFILCKDCTKAGFFSAKLVAEWKKPRPSAFCVSDTSCMEKFQADWLP